MGKKKPSSSSSAGRAPAPAAAPGAPASCEVVFAKAGRNRGHRQRGAGSVISDKGPRELEGGVVVQCWQRLPTQLLEQWAAKQKRPRPRYHSVAQRARVESEEQPLPGSATHKHKMRAVLPDPKVKTKDLTYVPAEYSASPEEAKQNAALIALLDFQSTLPLEQKLPEPYKTTWIQSLAAAKEAKSKPPSSKNKEQVDKQSKPPPPPAPSLGDSLWGAVAVNERAAGADTASDSATSPPTPSAPKAMVLTTGQRFTSQHERQQFEMKKQAENAARRRKREMNTLRHASAYATVMMSAPMRREVARALGLGVDLDQVDNDLSPDDLSVAERRAANELISQGFSMRHALLASVQADTGTNLDGNKEESEGDSSTIASSWLEWLCLHIPEEELPARYDPRGRNLDVHFSGGGANGSAKKLDAGDAHVPSPKNPAQHLVAAYGCWEPAQLSRAFKCASSCMYEEPTASALLPMIKILLEQQEEADTGTAISPRRRSCISRPLSAYDDEIMALEAIFFEEVRKDESAMADGCILLQISLGGPSSHGLPDDAALDMWLLQDTEVPLVLLRCKKYLADGCIKAAQEALRDRVAVLNSQGAGHDPVLFDVISYAKDSLAEVLSSTTFAAPSAPPPPSSERTGPNSFTTVRRAPHLDRRGGGLFGSGGGSRGRGSPPSFGRKGNPSSTMVEYRQGLPAANARREFLAAVRSSQVILVSGETGCGKSTQLPQFLLEQWEEAGKTGPFGAVVAQPRRIAAIGVATRVSEERGETVGDCVGYRVRGQNRVGPDAKLIFCTTGVLLRRLLSDSRLKEVTHLIIDEVHERHMESDFLLALLKSTILRERPDMKLILMSATLDIQRFQHYLSVSRRSSNSGVPVLSIPGRTFPVHRMFLEEALQTVGMSPMGGDAKGEVKVHGPPLSLVAEVVRRCLAKGLGGDGAVLVFMPGTWEIKQLCYFLSSDDSVMVLPLHGSLSPGDQARVFTRAPHGRRKIVVSTNVAEASITIPDVTVVIDGGRVKEMGYDPQRRMPQLLETWASKASMTQRAGRAGRVKAGVAIHLIHNSAHEKLLDHALPEMARAPLEALVLQILALSLNPKSVLLNALDPPEESAIDLAVDDLTSLGAMDDDGVLTPLGWHLSALPCPARVGKMLVYGAVLRCVSPILSIAAGLTCRSPFLKSDASTAAKLRMSNAAGGRSDHTALANALSEWEAESRKGGRRASAAFCEQCGLSNERMRELSDTRKQLGEALCSIGFLRNFAEAGDFNAHPNDNSDSWRVVKAAICAGLYPSVARVRRPKERFIALEGKGVVTAQAEAREHAFFTEADDRVFIHPSSANFTSDDWSSPWLVFHERIETSKPYIVDSTEALPYALLLFGGELSVSAEDGSIAVDEWIRFSAVGRIALLVGRLRQRLEALLLQKIEDPSADIAATPEIQAMVRILKTNGMG